LPAEQIVEIYRQLARNTVGYDGTRGPGEIPHISLRGPASRRTVPR
jgi:hypothetical protein